MLLSRERLDDLNALLALQQTTLSIVVISMLWNHVHHPETRKLAENGAEIARALATHPNVDPKLHDWARDTSLARFRAAAMNLVEQERVAEGNTNATNANLNAIEKASLWERARRWQTRAPDVWLFARGLFPAAPQLSDEDANSEDNPSEDQDYLPEHETRDGVQQRNAATFIIVSGGEIGWLLLPLIAANIAHCTLH
jgi:hypothetical protein